MNWLSIDFKETYIDLSPTFFRDEVISAFYDAFAKPLQTLADKTLYQMQHDSTVIYLEKVLNEYFEIATYQTGSHEETRQIYIIDGADVQNTYIYQTPEEQPLYLGTIYLNNETVATADFIIKIPSEIPFIEPRVRALVDFYKLAGKQYSIETY